MPDKPRYSADPSKLVRDHAELQKTAERYGPVSPMSYLDEAPVQPKPLPPPVDYGQLSPELNELPLDAVNVQVEPARHPQSPVLSLEGDPYEYQIGTYEVGEVPPVKARARGATEWLELPPGSRKARYVYGLADYARRKGPNSIVHVEGESPVPLPSQFGESPVPLPSQFGESLPVPTSQPMPLPAMGGGFQYPERDAIKAIVREALDEAAAESAQK